MCACACACACVHAYLYPYTHMHVYTHIHIYIRARAHTHTHAHTCTRTNTHVYENKSMRQCGQGRAKRGTRRARRATCADHTRAVLTTHGTRPTHTRHTPWPGSQAAAHVHGPRARSALSRCSCVVCVRVGWCVCRRYCAPGAVLLPPRVGWGCVPLVRAGGQSGVLLALIPCATTGTYIQEKACSLVWHYADCDQDWGAMQVVARSCLLVC